MSLHNDKRSNQKDQNNEAISSSKQDQKSNLFGRNLLLSILVIIANALVMYILFGSTRFSSLGKVPFLLANAITLLVLLLMDFGLMFAIRTKKKGLYALAITLLVVCLGVGSYGTYALARVNYNLDKITSKKDSEAVGVSFVVFEDDTNSSIKDYLDLEGKKVGLANDTNQAKVAKEELSKDGLDVEYISFTDYTEEIKALFSHEIDCAVLPTNYDSIFGGDEEGTKNLLEKTKVIKELETSVSVETNLGSDKDLTKEPFTVLLIGNADGLSDTIILCSVNPISMKITMSSIARDSYVPITCYNNASNKINAAHVSSKKCLIDTVEQLTGVKIDYYVDTNFKGVVEVVDALGGIYVDSPLEFIGQNSSSERGHFEVHVPKGKNVHMDGEQALCFARERYKFATGDFARQEHQQQVIAAMIKGIMQTRDVNTFLDVLDAAGNNIETNMSVEQMTGFVSYAMKKAGRYYDPNHVERVFTIVGSRITGFSSNLWNEQIQTMLYIYPLWQGAINDTKAAIERNTNLSSPIPTQLAHLNWSANTEFKAPEICKQVYAEAVKHPDNPKRLPDFVGKDLESAKEWAIKMNIALSANYVESDQYADGTIIEQNVKAGTNAEDIESLVVTVVGENQTTDDQASDEEKFKACKSADAVEALAKKLGYQTVHHETGEGNILLFAGVVSVDEETHVVTYLIKKTEVKEPTKEPSKEPSKKPTEPDQGPVVDNPVDTTPSVEEEPNQDPRPNITDNTEIEIQ